MKVNQRKDRQEIKKKVNEQTLESLWQQQIGGVPSDSNPTDQTDQCGRTPYDKRCTFAHLYWYFAYIVVTQVCFCFRIAYPDISLSEKVCLHRTTNRIIRSSRVLLKCSWQFFLDSKKYWSTEHVINTIWKYILTKSEGNNDSFNGFKCNRNR
jgi:hypothetical protein